MQTPLNQFTICICSFLYLTIIILAEPLPEDVEWLIGKRDEAVAQIDSKFVEELEKLKLKYTKSGDLESANAIVAIIEKYPAKTTTGVDTAEKPTISLDGNWLYRRGSANEGGSVRKFSGNYLVRDGGRHKVKQENGQVLIDFGGGTVHRFDIIDENTLRGKNHYGNTYQYVRVKE